MTAPPNDQRHKPYNGEKVLTVDRVEIVDGLRVYTNNLDQGVIDLSRAEYEWHEGERRYVLWFDVKLDTNYKGEPTTGREMQSDDRVITRLRR